MKLDTSHMRYLSTDDFRVLTAVEMGSKNHEVVPTKLIVQISGLRSASAVQRCIGELAKAKLVSRLRNASYDGFRLTYLGYDYLALKALAKRDSVMGLGSQIGIGKESDIFICEGNVEQVKNGQVKVSQKELVLKIHRLGRTSFRTVKRNRDYLRNRTSASWMYLSRLSAQKEFEFMKVLYEHGFPVPTPVDCSRHHVVMSLIDGIPMRQLKEHSDPARLYSTLMDFILKLANSGLIHCDFNEFNIMIKEKFDNPEDEIVVIDFPQCISTMHVDAKRYFERDVNCIRTFFERKLNYIGAEYPKWEDVERVESLDREVNASGLNKKQLKDLEKAMSESREEFGDEDDYIQSDHSSDDGDEDEEDVESEDEESYEGEEEENDDDDSRDEVDHNKEDEYQFEKNLRAPVEKLSVGE